MNIKRKNKNPKMIRTLQDILHVGGCLVVVIGTVLAVWDSKAYAYCFPVVFFAAGALCLGNGLMSLSDGGSRYEQRTKAKVQLAAAGVLFVVALISLLTVRSVA